MHINKCKKNLQVSNAVLKGVKSHVETANTKISNVLVYRASHTRLFNEPT